MLVEFLKSGNGFNDHDYKSVSTLPCMFVPMLKYYSEHKKSILATKQWYDFLVISNYMLYGIQLEILQLKKLKKC
jgi:hypothetical protein